MTLELALVLALAWQVLLVLLPFMLRLHLHGQYRGIGRFATAFGIIVAMTM